MVCDDVKRIAYFFLDETLGPDKRRQFVHHLKRCPPCESWVAVMKRLRTFVRNRLPRVVASGDLRARISRTVAQAGGRH